MSDIGADLRVVRTKEAIKTAFIELAEEKGFEATSVKDITTKAMINRGTFYSHYQDKYDLMTKCEEELVKELENKIIQKMPLVIANMETNNSDTLPFALLVPFFAFLQQNKRLVRILLGPKGDLSFHTKLKILMTNALFQGTSRPIINEEHLLVPREYFVSYVSSAHLGVIQEWVHSDRAEPPEEIARIIATMTINGPFFAAGLKK
ncbi:TetR/AcrR family transcriptional regulator [Mangrovibacillus cuniculi]|uniref:TetR/AcrR family transcriptional regulator n=1 Tax=Mangrovibacillus cuniculi TaxID=2593652 RepID=UPI001EFA22D2|nr:TetR/AcrR family transcriptional regulator [Mangrovibacillus cuniculi]